jgi:SPP1 gp7 family putative phage head morphogenesis protein
MIEPVRTGDIYLTRKQRQREAAHFHKVRNAENAYSVILRKIARHVAEIIRAYPIGNSAVLPELNSVLSRYSEVIRPLARAVASRMIVEVGRRDALAWRRSSESMGRNLRREIQETPIGDEVRRILEEQVDLITSIPIEAARRVQQFTIEYVQGGKRYEELVPLIQASGNVTVNRATLIARTEVAKAQSALTQARAKHIGATHYIWTTVMDADVRPAHKKLHGKTFAWDDPPIAEANGTRHHPGEFPRCRCFATPIIPDVIE